MILKVSGVRARVRIVGEKGAKDKDNQQARIWGEVGGVLVFVVVVVFGFVFVLSLSVSCFAFVLACVL